MILQMEQNLEDMMYDALKGVGVKTVTKFPNQPIEELAETLTKGMMMSYVGGVIKALDKKADGYSAICRAAFKRALLRLLKEAKSSQSTIINHQSSIII